MPRIARFGDLSPVDNRMKKGRARSMPQSVRLTVVLRTLIKTSPGFGSGTCRISRTSGDP